MKIIFLSGLIFLFILLQSGICNPQGKKLVAEQWNEVELSFKAKGTYSNPYTDVDFYAEFIGPDGQKLIRSGFWDGENTWKIRFSSPVDKGEWKYLTYCSNSKDEGLHGMEGRITSVPYRGENPLIRHGLLRMSEGKRNVVHADGTPFLMIGDTPWALPFRATVETSAVYAKNRQMKGFNTALLMTVQPDRDAKGPESRTEKNGFAVAFYDLKDGHINQMNVSYFQYFDSLRNILINHGIVPVYNPVFHGFGWKGMNVLGKNMDAKEYVRYCRYLVARYGAKPAIWLIGADSDGKDNGVLEAGKEVEEWDAYRQPTGLHYNPFDTGPMPSGSFDHTLHENKTHQNEDWLDFQWCQTGHGGTHLTDKVAKMYSNLPVKAVANGEPTYESNRGDYELGQGWWQGHEAWMQFLSGGTMGVVYGAGGVWNWQLFQDEEGWPLHRKGIIPAPKNWREALEYPGSLFVGYIGKALAGYPITDIEKRPDLAGGKLCLAKAGELYIVYLPEGGNVNLSKLSIGMNYRWFNPVTGKFEIDGTTELNDQTFFSGKKTPMILIVSMPKSS